MASRTKFLTVPCELPFGCDRHEPAATVGGIGKLLHQSVRLEPRDHKAHGLVSDAASSSQSGDVHWPEAFKKIECLGLRRLFRARALPDRTDERAYTLP
jgi:hypothetical protein